jgi:hypothetical protein
MVQTLFDRLLPRAPPDGAREGSARAARALRLRPRQHEQIRADLRSGRIGLAQNRLPASSHHRGRAPEDVSRRHRGAARELTSPAGWSAGRGRGGRGDAGRRRGQPLDQGAGVVKALHPFCRLGGGTAASSRSTWPRAAASAAVRHAAAARHHHQLPDPRPDRGYLAARGNYGYEGRCCCRPAAASACGWCPWRATCASPGRRCRSSCSTSRRRRCARACTRR